MQRNVDQGSKVDHEGVSLDTATLWSAPTERSGEGALARRACLATLKAVSRSACHRTPHIPHTTNRVVVARCTHQEANPSSLRLPHHAGALQAILGTLCNLGLRFTKERA
jgi:hypothetical protein